MTTSIVDYLNQQGKDSSYATRSKLAANYGISNYIGSAEQNTKLLSSLQGGMNMSINPTTRTVYGPPNNPAPMYGPPDNQSRLSSRSLNIGTSSGLDINKALNSGGLTLDNQPPSARIMPNTAPPVDINKALASGGLTVNQPRSLLSGVTGGGGGGSWGETPTIPDPTKIATQIIQAHQKTSNSPTVPTAPVVPETAPSVTPSDSSTTTTPTPPTTPAPTDNTNDLIKQRYTLMNALFNDATDISASEVGILSPDQYTVLKNKDKNGIEKQLALLDTSLNYQYQQKKEAEAAVKEAASANKPIEVGGNLVKLNPTTGKYEVVYQGPEKAANTPTSYDEWQLAGSPGTYADFLQSRKGLNAIQSASVGFADRMHSSNDIINKIGQQFTGTTDFGGYLPNVLQGSDRQLFEQAKRDFVTAKLRQESGAAISDSEFARADKQYFPQAGDSPAVVTQKKANREMIIKGMETMAGPSYKDNSSYVAPDNQNYDALDAALKASGAPGFSKVGGDTKKIATAIGQFESGGNYKAIGPKTSSGDKAYGKYQVMGANIPSWTKEAIGKSYSIAEFYNSPRIQDQVAHYKMGKLYQQYGNVGDVASVWFSGRPIKKAGNAKDVIGTSVPQYVSNVQHIYNSLG